MKTTKRFETRKVTFHEKKNVHERSVLKAEEKAEHGLETQVWHPSSTGR